MQQTALSRAIAGAGGGGDKPRTPIEAPDSLRSIAYARILDMVGEGEIYGLADRDNPLSCVFFNETPVANNDGSFNFKNFSIESRVGTQDQDFISGFEGVESELAIGVELRANTPWVRSITNLNVTSARVRISVPALTKSNPENGDVNGSYVSYRIEVATDGGSYNTVLNGAFRGKTTTKYERSHRIDLPPASVSGWAIRVTRFTADSDSVGEQNATYIESFAEIIDAKLRMPMTALVACIVDAEQFSNIPARAYLMRGRIIRVPSNYDPDERTYTGVWDGTFVPQYSNNPAWCFYDMVTNSRYGLGHLVPESLVDKWALYKIGMYCDQMVSNGKGGVEPRFTTNLFLQQQAEALRVMQDMATMFRGIMYAAGGTIVPVADMPDVPVYTYNPTNVVDGRFTYGGSSRKVRHTVALVSWNDPNDFSRAKVEYVEDEQAIARYGYQPTSVIATGCASQSQARRWGRYLLATAQYETDGVEFSVGLDGTVVAPGKVVLICDPLRAGRRTGGRVVEATTTTVTVDILPVAGVGDVLTCILPTGVAQQRDVVEINGRTLTVSPAFDAAPVGQSVWALESTEISANRVRVLAVKERGDGKGYDLTGIQQVEGKYAYADEGVPIDEPPIGAGVQPAVPSPVNITATQRDVTDQYTSNIAVDVAWEPVTIATGYTVQWRQSDGEWSAILRTSSTTVEVPNLRQGSLEVQVTAFDAKGRESLPAFGGPFAIGAVSTPPGVVVDIITNQEVLEQIGLDNQAAIAQEIIDRAAADAQVQIDAAQDATAKVAAEATARANAILNERNAWTAAVEEETTLRESEDESLAIALSLVSAGSGEQFDSRKIWYFDADLESWTGTGTPTIVDGWLRPANGANAYVQSPDSLGIEGESYRFVKLRIKRVGNPVWSGRLQWTTTTDNTFNTAKQVTLPEPSFDANGVTTIAFDDIGWWPATVRRIRLTLATSQAAANYFLIDWVAIGRPTPGAGVALVQDETAARVAGDSANASQTTTLAVQMRGNYTGTDVAGVTQGLVYSERQARISADGVIASDVSSLQARMPAGSGKVATEASVTSEATARANGDSALGSRASAIEARLPGGSGQLATSASVTSVESASVSRDNALGSRVGAVEARMPTGSGELATAAGLSSLTGRVTTAEGNITAQGTALTQVQARLGDSANNLVHKSIFDDGGVGYWSSGGATNAVVGTHPARTRALQLTGTSYEDLPLAIKEPAKEGDVFDMQCDVRNLAAGSGGFAGTFYMRARFFDAAGATIGYDQEAGSGFTPGSGWTSPTFKGLTAPAGTAYVAPHITLSSVTSGGVVVTNLSMRRRTTAEMANADAAQALDARVTSAEGQITATASDVTALTSTVGNNTASLTILAQATAAGQVSAIPNPSFDSALGDWGDGSASTGVVGAPGAFAANVGYSTVTPHTGTGAHCLRFNATSGNLGVGHQGYIPCASGQVWDLSWWARKAASAGGSARVYVSWYDSDKVFLDYAYIWSLSCSSMSTSWTQFSASWQPPANAVYFRVIVTSIVGSAPGSLFYDDLNVRLRSEIENKAMASYSLTLDVNGYVTGFRSENTGSSSSFDIVADKFRIVAPGGGARTEFSGGNWRVYDSSGTLRCRMGVW